MKLDFAVVTFFSDYRSLELLLKSIDLYVPNHLLGKVVIFWNNKLSTTRVQFDGLQQIVSNSGSVSNNVMVVAREEVTSFDPDILDKNGWRAQQALKIIAANYCTNEHIVLIDSKNHFIRQIRYDDFFDTNSRLLTNTSNYNNGLPEFLEFAKNGLAYFSVNSSEQILSKSLPTVTPFSAYRHILRSVITRIEEIEGTDIFEAFLTGEAAKSTEFLLYNGAVHQNGRGVEDLYGIRDHYGVQNFFGGWPNEPKMISDMLSHMDSGNTYAIGIQRSRYPKLSETEVSAFRRIWMERGLLKNDADCDRYLVGMGYVTKP